MRQSRSLPFWFLFNLCFGVFPCVLLFFALSAIQEREVEVVLRQAAARGERFLQNLSGFADPKTSHVAILRRAFNLAAKHRQQRIALGPNQKAGSFQAADFAPILREYERILGPEIEWLTSFGRFHHGRFHSYSPEERRQLNQGSEMFLVLNNLKNGQSLGKEALENHLPAFQQVLGPIVQFDLYWFPELVLYAQDHLKTAKLLIIHQGCWLQMRVPHQRWSSWPLLVEHIRKFNRSGKSIATFGLVETPAAAGAETRVLYPGTTFRGQQTLPAFFTYLKQRAPLQRRGDLAWFFFPLDPDHWGALRIPLASRLERHLRSRTAFGAALLLFLLLVAGYSWHFLIGCPGEFLSLKWKFGLLFLFANGVPLCVLSFLGLDYLQQRRVSLKQDIRQEAERTLRDFDRGFYRQIWTLQHHLGNICTFLERHIPDKGLHNRAVLDELARRITSFPASSFFLLTKDLNLLLLMSNEYPRPKVFDRNSEWPEGMPHQEWEKLPGFEPDHLGELLLFGYALYRCARELNQEDAPDRVRLEKVEMVGEKVMNRSIDDLLNEGLRYFGQIRFLGVGLAGRYWWFDLLSSTGRKPFEYQIMMGFSWRLLVQYCRATHEQLARRHPGWLFFSFSNQQYQFPRDQTSTTPPVALFNRIRFGREPFQAQEISHNGQPFLAFSYRCREMHQSFLFALVPLGPLTAEMAMTRRLLLMTLVLSLVFSAGLAQFLVRRFLLPIADLEGAAQAIARKDFSRRPTSHSNDELGLLVESFRGVMTNLEELSLSRVVQEALFPHTALKVGCLSVFGKSLPMGDLGGDTFDYFPVPEQRLGIFFGDVAGHGLPAAIIMAMAKGTVMNSPHLADQPTRLLLHLNAILALQTNRTKRLMMTAVYLIGDGQTGQASFAIAGQSYPVLVNAGGTKAEYLRTSSQPLGIVAKPNLDTWQATLGKGETLVFYTDGAVETSDQNGTMVGYEAWPTWIRESWDPDLTVMYQRLLDRHLAYRQGMPPQDDMTLVFLRRDS